MLPSSNPADTSKPAWCVLPESRETGEGVLLYQFYFQRCIFVLTNLLPSSPKRQNNRVYSTQGGTCIPHSKSALYLNNSKKTPNNNRNLLSFN